MDGEPKVSSKTTWVVICTPETGRPFPEYVEGTQLITDTVSGMISILDSGQLVRQYMAGTWSNFAEWVTLGSNFAGRVIRLMEAGLPDLTVPLQRSTEASELRAGRSDSPLTERRTAISPHRTTELDGAVRTTLPGQRKA